MDLQLPTCMQSVPIITNVVSLNPAQMRCTRYNIMWQGLSVSVVFSGYSGFLHQRNWMPWYSWNIVESGTKHHNPNLIPSWVDFKFIRIHTSFYKSYFPYDRQNGTWSSKSYRKDNNFKCNSQINCRYSNLAKKSEDNFLATRKQSSCYNIKNYVQSCKKT